ncbi:MAG: tyrosine--tRNA ligase [Acidimicrobiales bacterium]|nr:tyrosine--tRNA ligase [Acidimicrobiales bacterium]
MSGPEIINDLEARGLIHDSTDLDELRARLERGPITVYSGFDPTADSLHIGNLVPLLLLRRFQLFGHHPIALAGGATGMIGDPGGRSEERNLLDDETLSRNVTAIKAQLRRFLDFECVGNPAHLVDNRDWIAPMSAIEFLRDVGKHITVNQMMAKESVKARVNSDSGISFTEFSYMLLQAFDFRWLMEHFECELQVGGSDQWGNITAGIDLIRKTLGREAYGLTVPLITRSDGVKFGKSTGGAVWLDAERTSPYELYQWFINIPDADVERFLLQLTLLPPEEAVAIAAAHREAPERRVGQRALAREVTALVHGDAAASEAEAASREFTRSASELRPEELAALAGEIPTTEVAADRLDGIDIVDLLVDCGLAKSKGDARRTIEQGGIYLNDVPVGSRALAASDLLHGRYLMLRRGKKTRHLIVAT